MNSNIFLDKILLNTLFLCPWGKMTSAPFVFVQKPGRIIYGSTNASIFEFELANKSTRMS